MTDTTTTPAHLVVFALNTNSKTKEPQWQARSKNGKTMYVPNKDGVQPDSEHAGWKVEEAFVAFTDEKNGFRIVIVNLLEEIPKAVAPAPHVRILRTNSIDKAVEPKTSKAGIVQMSARTIARAARAAQAATNATKTADSATTDTVN
jgi:hypothetical protein